MSTRYSTQMQKQVDAGNSLINAITDRGAYRRIEFFSRNTTDAVNGNLANADTVVLVKLPKGAVVLGGTLQTGALGAGVTATVAVGAQNLITAATSVAAASATAIASTVALGYGYVAPSDIDVILTIGGATPAGAILINGHVDYVCN